MPVPVEIDQEIVLDLLDELKPLIQGYLSEPDIESQTEVFQILDSLYGYIANRPLSSSTRRKIGAGRF